MQGCLKARTLLHLFESQMLSSESEKGLSAKCEQLSGTAECHVNCCGSADGVGQLVGGLGFITYATSPAVPAHVLVA